ncbi:hypothetical protein [Halorubrum aethiopicum]|uniref:hypothetical protein n=1 Tax=Halorubrum aethiopicum TaxID=1758255 RepID=UPI000B2F9D8A|nr:hypothetical protein [Halorubrum aethiopicum]
MSDTSFTLLEIHLEEGAVRIGEYGLLGGGKPDGNADEEEADDAGSADAADAGGGILGCGLSSTSILGGMAVVALLAALGVAAARVLGDADLEDAADIDDLGA